MRSIRAIAHPSRSVRGLLISLLALCGLALWGSTALAVTFPWANLTTSTTASTTNGTGVSTLADGSSIATGNFTGTDVDLGMGALASAEGGVSQSAFIRKIDPAGAVAWQFVSTGTLASSASADGVSTLDDGSSIVTGTFTGTDVEMGTGPLVSAEGGLSPSAFTMEIDPGGAVAWVITSNSAGASTAGGTGVSTLADRSSIVTGNFQGAGVDFGVPGAPLSTSAEGGLSPSAFTMAIDPAGVPLWVVTSDSATASTTGATGVSTLADGSSIVTGNFTGTDVNLGTGALASAEGGLSQSSFTMKIDPNGVVLWVVTSDSATASTTGATGVSTLADGSSVVTGFFTGTDVNLGTGALASAELGASQSAFAEGIDPSGVVTWVWTSGGASRSTTTAAAVSTLPDGSSVVTGTFECRACGVDFNFGANPPYAGSGGGASNSWSAFTLKLNAAGAVQWVQRSQDPTRSVTGGTGVSALPDGSALVTGSIQGSTVDLGSGTSSVSAEGGASQSAFTQKILAAPQAPAAPVAVEDITSATVIITPLVGGSVTSYTVTTSTGGRTCTITAPDTSCIVDGLNAGISYSFTATATNAAGTSVPSAASNAVTPTHAPILPSPPAPPAPPADQASGGAAGGVPGERSSAPTVLSVRTTCTKTRCVTKGASPTGVTRITQTATSATSGGKAKTARGTCTIKAARTYTCAMRLSKGTWTITTNGFASATGLMAQAVKTQRVR
jgi:hypothetical protein